MPIPTWNAQYPDPALLRDEAREMAHVISELLLEALGAERLRGIYLKGSVQKKWSSPIDYVPQVSDVDIHVWLKGEKCSTGLPFALSEAIALRSEVEARFHNLRPFHIHFPRPQICVINDMHAMPDYVGPAPGMCEVLWGEEYPCGDYSDEDAIREIDRRALADEGMRLLGWIIPNVIDKTGRYFAHMVYAVNYRVSPTGPRVLSALGMAPAKAWALNRTEITRALTEMGESTLAADYAAYYLAAWRWFLSGVNDFRAAEEAVEAAVKIVQRGAEIAATR